jgi:uncharacterized protein (TIGR00288 family)
LETTNGLGGAKIALLIDFDNVILGIDDPGFDVELVVNALRERGLIVLGRVYGDWYRHNRHRRRLMEQGLELVETPAFGPVIKNSADIRIALDGYEIGMTHHHIDTFCIVSGDSDFLPLIKKLQSLGKRVLVICGSRFTSDMVRRNCNEFISYENLLADSVGATEDATTLDGSFVLLHRAMAALRERGSEIRTSTLKQMMLQLNPVFSERNFGCSHFRGFLDKAIARSLVKMGPRDKVSGEFYVLLPDEDEPSFVDKVPATSNGRAAQSETVSTRPERRRGGRSSEPVVVPVVAQPTAEAIALPEPEAIPIPEIAPPDLNDVEANESDLSEHGISRGELISRGLRRGRLKFSARTGTVSNAPTADLPSSTAPAPDAQTNELLPIDEAPTDSSTATDALEAVAQLVEEQAAQGLAGADGNDSPMNPTEALPETEDAPKKPARRRRRTRSNAEKAVVETSPATDEEAAQNVADANAAELTFPGQAFEIAPAATEPIETSRQPANWSFRWKHRMRTQRKLNPSRSRRRRKLSRKLQSKKRPRNPRVAAARRVKRPT